MSSRQPPPATCANCGATLPRHAQACPECGADERTGWRDAPPYDGLDLPESAFADAQADTASPQGRSRHALKWYWLAAALLVLILLIRAALALW